MLLVHACSLRAVHLLVFVLTLALFIEQVLACSLEVSPFRLDIGLIK